MHVVRPYLTTGGAGGWCIMISLAIDGDTYLGRCPRRVSRTGQATGIMLLLRQGVCELTQMR
jgi:hypothetical protein